MPHSIAGARDGGLWPVVADICDTHAHVFPAGFPFAANARYTTPPRELEAYAAVMEALGIARTVFVTPSVYGTHNASMLAALDACGVTAKGVGTVAREASHAELSRLRARDVVGIRLPTALEGPLTAEALAYWSRRLSVYEDMHIDILLGSIADIEPLADTIADSAVPIVIDHLGRTRSRDGVGHPGFSTLVGLLTSYDHVWVKLSSWYRLSDRGSPYSDMAPIVQSLIGARPQRLLWGTNWPHSGYSGPPLADADLFEVALNWLGDQHTIKAVLADNPARLYGFGAGAPGTVP